jgi:transcriptional regulator with XRE-family HTH domain
MKGQRKIKKELLKEIGKKLKARREELGLQLQDVAKESGVTYMWISKLEKGELDNISLETLLSISIALKFSPDVVFSSLRAV